MSNPLHELYSSTVNLIWFSLKKTGYNQLFLEETFAYFKKNGDTNIGQHCLITMDIFQYAYQISLMQVSNKNSCYWFWKTTLHRCKVIMHVRSFLLISLKANIKLFLSRIIRWLRTLSLPRFSFYQIPIINLKHRGSAPWNHFSQLKHFVCLF